jgi:hypothetical protein
MMLMLGLLGYASSRTLSHLGFCSYRRHHCLSAAIFMGALRASPPQTVVFFFILAVADFHPP